MKYHHHDQQTAIQGVKTVSASTSAATKFIPLLVRLLLFLLIVLLGYQLRLQRYASVPLPGQSLDEYSYSWVGLSLIRLGVPVGISGLPGYPTDDWRYVNVDRIFQSTAQGNPLSINYPWFDHPPLMGLVTGGFAYLKGARVFEDTVATIIRRPVIYLGVLTLILVFILADLHFGYAAALAAALIYATMPLVVISSRLIQAENGMIPMMLISLIFTSLFLHRRRHVWLLLAGMFAGIAVLFKLSGIVSIVATVLILYLARNQDRKKALPDILFFLIVSLPFVSLFCLYGAVYDWRTFVTVLADNSIRFYGIGANAVKNLLVESRVTQDKTLADAWPFVLWIGFFLTFLREKTKEFFFSSVIVIYLLIYVFLGSYPFGWYALPFWPLLAILFGHYLTDTLRDSRLVLVNSLLLSFPITQNITQLIDINEFQRYAAIWRLGFTAFILLAFYRTVSTNQRRSRLTAIWLGVILIIAVMMNIRFLGTLTVDRWYWVN
jgi:4-amino-4-deoxy-L-arabinose transferase-like glycosyltransferase